jgi:hypothetical protein
MQVEEGRDASSWRRAAAAASTPSVSSHAQRKPRRSRQEVCRTATCAREEVRGGRGGGGGEDGRDMGKKTVAAWGIPAAGGGNRGRGARCMLKREERRPRAAAGGCICRGRGWRGRQGREEVSSTARICLLRTATPSCSASVRSTAAASRSTRQGSGKCGSWGGAVEHRCGPRTTELHRASGPRRRRAARISRTADLRREETKAVEGRATVLSSLALQRTDGEEEALLAVRGDGGGDARRSRAGEGGWGRQRRA